MLEQAIENVYAERQRDKVGGMIQVSGIRFEYDTARPHGSRLGAVVIGKTALAPERTYRVVTNSMLAEGGHSYRAFTEAAEKRKGPPVYDIVKAWFGSAGAVTPPPTDADRKVRRPPAFTLSSFVPAVPVHLDPRSVAGARPELRYGEQRGSPEMRALGGAFLFDRAVRGLPASLLRALVHVRHSDRLSQLVTMVREETADQKPGHAFVMSRLVELLLVEAMRSLTRGGAPPGLLRGLGDERLARVLTHMHGRPDEPWSIDALARIAALSRSAFFARFTRLVGMAPMGYLLAWRMELAKGHLRDGELAVADIAARVGYGSTSAFSVAFSRFVGRSPRAYARDRQAI